MKSYIRLTRGSLYELGAVLRPVERAKERAAFVDWRTSLARAQIYESYGVAWRNQNLLEVGCGQALAYTLAFAQQNKVTGIDTEPPFHRPYIRSFIDLLRFSGPYRTAKTSANAILGTRRWFKRGLSEVTQFAGSYDFELARMNALALSFPDNSFDGVFSFSVFEHISEPSEALEEVKRVLKPNGVFYLDLHLYTSMNGDHDFRPTLEGAGPPPWKHIRPSCASTRVETCYLNKIRLAEWKQMLGNAFEDVKFLAIGGETEKYRPYLTEAVRSELEAYTEDELLTTTLIAIARKK